jgi:hypothetical protein
MRVRTLFKVYSHEGAPQVNTAAAYDPFCFNRWLMFRDAVLIDTFRGRRFPMSVVTTFELR